VAKHQAVFEFAQIDAEFHAPFPAWRKLDGSGTTECRRIVILRASGHANHNAFRVTADVNPVDLALPCPCETVQGSANRYGHGTGTPDASTSRGFGVGGQGEPAFRPEKLGDFCQKRQLIVLRFHHAREGSEILVALCIARDKADSLILAV